MVLKNINRQKKYLLAVSGGIDSMVMCDLFLKTGMQFSVAHCNFQLRGDESDGDEALVEDWCKQNNIRFFTRKMNTLSYAEENKYSVQVAARELRYQYFFQIMENEKFDYIATAHHQDDNIETVLFHFFRGTGIQGLTGIPLENDNIIRPLLHVTKDEIVSYASEHKIRYRNDSSNNKTDYTRNKLRNDLIPQLEELFPAFKNNIAQNITRLNEVNTLYKQQVNHFRKKLIEQRGKDYYIPVLKLKHVSPVSTILYELLKPFEFNFEQSEQALLLLDSESGRMVENTRYRIFKNRNFLIVTERLESESEIILIAKDTRKLTGPDFDLHIQTVTKDTFQLQTDLNTCQIHAEAVEYPLLLRKWRQGDYMYPLGMKKKKKIARILIDAKISMVDKEKVWVLESNKKIVWLIGLKIDDRFKVQANTNEIIIINIKKKV